MGPENLKLIGPFVHRFWLALGFCLIASKAAVELPLANEPARGGQESSSLASGDRRSVLCQIEENEYAGRRVSSKTGDDRRVANNLRQGMRIEFGADSVAVRQPAVKETQLRLRLMRYGYGSALQPATPAEEIVAIENRVEYRRGELIEWYENTAAGLEQGFTLLDSPTERSGHAPLRLEIEFATGLRPTLDAGGTRVLLLTAEGHPAYTYDKLIVTDATGRVRPARMELAGETDVALIVDDSDASYPLIIDPLLVAQQARLMTGDGGREDYFGLSTAISGTTLVVGAYGHNSQRGAAYVFMRSGTNWVQQAKLTAQDGASSDRFGNSVAIDSDTVIVGARSARLSGSFVSPGPGAVYVFARSGTSWSQQARLVAGDTLAGHEFGGAVAVAGNTALVGAPGQGSAYVFSRSGTNWTQQAKLLPIGGTPLPRFGGALAVAGENSVIVGTHVFTRTGSIWSEPTVLVSSDLRPGDDFGNAAAISSDTAVIGAQLDRPEGDGGFRAPGAAYVFTRNGAAWSQQAKLTASDIVERQTSISSITEGATFGNAVAIFGDTIVVGARYDKSGDGSVYVFTRMGSTWIQRAKIMPIGGQGSTSFGASVALGESAVVVGAPLEDGFERPDQGAAYVYGISVSEANSAPVVANVETSTLIDTENAAPVALTSTLTVADADSTNLTNAVVRFSQGYVKGEDVLLFTEFYGIKGSFLAGSGLLNLTGLASPAHYQAALQRVQYTNTSDHPSALSRTVTFQVTDIDGSPSNIQARNIRMIGFNDPPVNDVEAANVYLWSTIAGLSGPGNFGSADGIGSAARFGSVSGLAVDNAGNVIVADGDNHTIRKITPSGVVSTLAGSPGAPGSTDGTAASARFRFPRGVAVDSTGNIYVADTENHKIRKINVALDVGTLAGSGVQGTIDGIGSAARFSRPEGIAVDAAGNVYVADTGVYAIRKVAPSGTVSTFATQSSFAADKEGVVFTATPVALAVDGAGNLYVADRQNNAIRKINPEGTVRTIGGGPVTTSGSTDGKGSAARFNQPGGVAVDSSGTVYVGDAQNNTIRKGVSPTVTEEDMALVFSTTNGNRFSVMDSDAGSSAIQIMLSVQHGTLTLNGTTGLDFAFKDTAGIGSGDGAADATMIFRGSVSDINKALNNLVYAPAPNHSGYDTLSITSNDLGRNGSGGAGTDTDSVGITILSINDTPADKTITLAEDSTYAFRAADFGFSVPDSGTASGFNQVKIESLPGAGTIRLNNTPIAVGALISLADIKANKLTLTPALNATGVPHTTFTFQGGREGDAPQSGVFTMTVNVTAVNDPPMISLGQTAIQTDEGTAVTFSAANGNGISVSDVDAGTNPLKMSVSVIHGGLTSDPFFELTGSLATLNARLEGLRYSPSEDFSGADELTITVTDQGNIGGGALATAKSIPISVRSINDAPFLNSSKLPLLDAIGQNAPAPVGPVGTLIGSGSTDGATQVITGLIDDDVFIGNVSDRDPGTQIGIAVTEVAASGTWFFSTDNGLNWSLLGPVNEASARLLAADGLTRIYFQPNAGVAGLLNPALTFRAWDRTTGSNGGLANTGGANQGGTTAFSSGVDSALIHVNPVSGPPGPAAFAPLVTTDPIKLLAGDGVTTSELKIAAAPSGNTLALVTDRPGFSNGAVSVFVRNGMNWSRQPDFYASGVDGNDAFGSALAIDGDTVIVGSSSDDVSSNFDQGSAYVFARSGATWTQQAKLTAGDGAGGDRFGDSVAIAGDILMIGSPGASTSKGAVYVFTRSGTAWTQQAKLVASSGATGSVSFGSSVAIASDTAIIGAMADYLGKGSAYVFTRSGTTWTQQANLTASDGTSGDNFGRSVALSGETVVVGADGQKPSGSPVRRVGSAYVFVRNGSVWTQQAKLTVTDPIGDPVLSSGANFGYPVAISSDTVTISERIYNSSNSGEQGSSYLFTRSGTTWTQRAKLAPANVWFGDRFGTALAMAGDTVVCGLRERLNASAFQGAVLVFTLNPTGLSAGTDKTITMIEDGTYNLVAGDFGFLSPTDTPPRTLSRVKITTLPAAGTLKLNGSPVAAGAFINLTDINASKLTFAPALNGNGSRYASFTFQVEDDGGTANGRINLDSSPNTITFSVTLVNDPPTGTNTTITIAEDSAYPFRIADFGFTDPAEVSANSLTRVKIASLPAVGTLRLTGTPVNAGDFVTVADLVANKLTFAPAAHATGNPYASFTFQIEDDGGTANNAVNLDQSPNTMTIHVGGPDARTGARLTGGFPLYAADFLGNSVVKITSDGSISTFATGFDNPLAMAFDSAGDLYVANDTIGTISKVTPNGTVSTFATGFNRPRGLISDSADNLYVTDSGFSPTGPSISKITPDGHRSTFAAVGGRPMAFDSHGNLYVGSAGTTKILEITPGGDVSPFSTFTFDPIALAFDAAENLYAVSVDEPNVFKIARDGSVSVFADIPRHVIGTIPATPDPISLSFDASGNLYVGNHGNNGGGDFEAWIVKVTPNGIASTLLSGSFGAWGLLFQVPVVTSAHAANGIYRSSFNYTITADGAPTSFGAPGLPAGLTVDTSTGVISGSPKQPGTFPVALIATGSSGTARATLSLTIEPAVLTVTGITANNKLFDGTAVAALNPSSAGLVGVVSGDTVVLNTGGAVGEFSDSAIGANKPVKVSGLTISGADAGKYKLVQPAATASILNNPPTITTIGASPTVFEQKTSAFLFGESLVDVVEAGQKVVQIKLTIEHLSDGSSEKLIVDEASIALVDGNSVTTARNGYAVSVRVIAKTGTITITKAGGISAPAAQLLLDELAYSNASANPSGEDTRIVTLTQIRDDGGTAGGASDTTTLSVVSSVTVIPVNDPPVLTGASLPLPLEVVQQAKLLPSDGASNDSFGDSVAISGDTVIIGASWDDVGSNPDQGSAYVFTRSGTTWIQQAKLTASDGASTFFFGVVLTGDHFGESVSIAGDTVVVGALYHDAGGSFDQGSAYVFTRSGTTWTQQAKLTASDGLSNDRFGRSVSISGETVVIGASGDQLENGSSQGSAYVFTRSGTTWTQQAKLAASDGAREDSFGVAVSLFGDTVVIGAVLDDVGSIVNQGSAYVFARSGTTWTQQAKLTASDGVANGTFGSSVAISADKIVVGAPAPRPTTDNHEEGAAYVFTRSGSTWTEQRKLRASDGAFNHEFGTSVSVFADTAMVGAILSGNLKQGSTYPFTMTMPTPPVPALPGLQISNEDASLTFEIPGSNGISVTDLDAGTAPIQMSLSAQHGTLKLNSAALTALTFDSGAHNTGHMVVRGKLSDLNAALNGMAYTPELNFYGEDAMAIFVDDQGSTGAGGPMSAQALVPIIVRPVVDGMPVVNNVTTPYQRLSEELMTIQRNPVDGPEVRYFQISEITGGRLFFPDGRSEINNGNFMTAFEAEAGLRFLPADMSPGSFKIQAALNDEVGALGGSKATATITVFKADQFIAFAPIPPKVFGALPFTVNATASSGLPVQFQVNGPATISGSTLTITGAGAISVTASQPGDDRFNPAPHAVQLLAVAKASQTVAFGPIANRIYGDAPFDVLATASSGLPVRVEVNLGQAVMTADGKVQIVQTGFVTLVASQDGNVNFNPAQTVFQTFSVAKAPLAITVNDATRSFGSPNPTFTGSVSGLRNNDPVTVEYASNPNPSSPSGAYDIFPILQDPAGRLPNYTLNITRGKLTVTPNAAPVAQAQTVSTDEDTAKLIELTGTDSDGANLTFAIVQGAQNGTLAGSPPTVTYTPNSNFNGTDYFTFKVNDTFQDSSPATVTIVVSPVNDPPTLAQIPNIGVLPNGPIVTIPLFGITPGPSDEEQAVTVAAASIDSTKIAVQGVVQPAAGQNGAVRIQAAANVTSGSADITVTVSDGASVNATFSRTFTAVITPRGLRVVDTAGQAGALVSVPVELEAQGNENRLSFSVRFETALLRFANIALGADTQSPSVQAGLEVRAQHAVEGRVGASLALPSGQTIGTGSKQVVLLSFHISESAPNGTMSSIGLSPDPTVLQVQGAAGNSVPVAFAGGTVTINRGYEGDVAPRPYGSNDGTVTPSDWVQVGLFALNSDSPASPGEFQRADCAPRALDGQLVLGDGVVNLADWVQAGRYALGLDAPVPKAGGPVQSTPTPQGAERRPGSLAPQSLHVGRDARRIHVQDRVVSAGQGFLVWIGLDSQGDENALGFSLDYDPRAMEFVGARLASGAHGAMLLTNGKELERGRLGMALALPPGQTFQRGLRSLIVMEFASSMTAGGSLSRIRFVDDPVRRAVAMADAHETRGEFDDGTILIEEAGAAMAGWPRSPKLNVVTRLPEGDVLLRLAAEAGREYFIDVSEDLVKWRPLRMVSMAAGDFEFADVEASRFPSCYYRLRELSR
ncbi:MAG: tandem-95 repeat protein [Verrucomicrobia bacterium]|nr:tandem-95 repeat protein [Verrucomicrobiota bacterium]